MIEWPSSTCRAVDLALPACAFPSQGVPYIPPHRARRALCTSEESRRRKHVAHCSGSSYLRRVVCGRGLITRIAERPCRTDYVYRIISLRACPALPVHDRRRVIAAAAFHAGGSGTFVHAHRGRSRDFTLLAGLRATPGRRPFLRPTALRVECAGAGHSQHQRRHGKARVLEFLLDDDPPIRRNSDGCDAVRSRSDALSPIGLVEAGGR